jgi:nucleoside-diphosphate-sugar epimerase
MRSRAARGARHCAGEGLRLAEETGFVGSHIVSALVCCRGHTSGLLVRRPEQVPVSFAPIGIAPSELVVGDAADSDVGARGIDGCDAVVHAAAVFSLRRRDA